MSKLLHSKKRLCCVALVIWLTACSTAQMGGERRFDVVSAPSGADVYLVPRYEAEQNGWIGMNAAALQGQLARLGPYLQGQTPTQVTGNDEAYLLVIARGGKVASRIIHPNSGDRIKIDLPL
jgi:hypothetical protein